MSAPLPAAQRPPMHWVYDARGLDLTDWAARAPTEIGATATPGDTVLMLVEARDAPAEALAAALVAAGLPVCWTTIEQQVALAVDIPSPPAGAG